MQLTNCVAVQTCRCSMAAVGRSLDCNCSLACPLGSPKLLPCFCPSFCTRLHEQRVEAASLAPLEPCHGTYPLFLEPLLFSGVVPQVLESTSSAIHGREIAQEVWCAEGLRKVLLCSGISLAMHDAMQACMSKHGLLQKAHDEVMFVGFAWSLI